MGLGIEINTYNPVHDKVAIETLLHGNDYYRENFHEVEKNYSNCIFIATYNDSVVGFLSFSGYVGRGTITTIFVGEKYRRKGIGTILFNKSDQILSKCEAIERSLAVCFDNNDIEFVKKHGYFVSYSEYQMERIGDYLPYGNITVRTYEDNDFLQWHFICETAFYIMNENTGVRPLIYYPIGQGGYDRNIFMNNKNDRYVMIVNNEIAAIGLIKGNELKVLAVRPDLQAKGLGKIFASYLINEIIRRGNKTVVLNVVNGNYAKNLYTSLGFKEKLLFNHVLKFYRPDSRLHMLPNEYTLALKSNNLLL